MSDEQKNTLIMNGDRPYPVTNKAADVFIGEIQKQRQEGYGFVPFIGAGFSAPAGAPLIWDIKSYLERCICMALVPDKTAPRAWNPRTDQWPPFIDRDRPGRGHWWDTVLNEFNDRKIINQWDPELPVFQEALGAMAEWRTSLLFLSRLARERQGAGQNVHDVLVLEAPQQEIIDACLREVLKEKHPALGHRMLAVLAGALRLDLILTTNFDDLLERAFEAARNPLEVFEIHLGSSLPNWSAVSNVRSLIKLHGSRYSLRADYSLDGSPSELDKQRFLEYLLSSRDRAALKPGVANQQLDFQNHLLVMGFSAADRRCRAFIEHAWASLGDDFRVFWICYSQEDVKNITKFTQKAALKYDKPDDWKGSIVLRFKEQGLLLLQLYQTIRNNLPPHGLVFPSISRLALPPLPSLVYEENQPSEAKGEPSEASIEKFRTDLISDIRWFQNRVFRKHSLIVATAREGVSGLTSACADVFGQLESEFICLWIDMNDIASTDNLFETLLEAAYFRLGLENWTPVYVSSDPVPRAAEIKRLVNSVNLPWVIFLNARETPGANTGFIDKDEIAAGPVEKEKFPNGWLDYGPDKPGKAGKGRTGKIPGAESAADNSDTARDFVQLLSEMTKTGPVHSELTSADSETKRISIVLLCRDENEQDGLIKTLTQNQLLESKREFPEPKGYKGYDDTSKHPEQIISEKGIEWTQGCKQRRRFLHALMLMQRPRLLATIWCPAVSLNSSFAPCKPGCVCEKEAAEIKAGSTAHRVRQNWLNDLEKKKLLRRKPGGFIWVHSTRRQRIREVLSLSNKDLVGKARNETLFIRPAIFKDWTPINDEPEIHTQLASWYEKVLDASEAPTVVFEIVYHLCRAAVTYSKAEDKNRFEKALDRVESASALLKTHSFSIQTLGYSRGSCRRLEHIRDTLCPEINKAWIEDKEKLLAKTRYLQMVCTEVMRAIAREVGEDRKAYIRQQQFGVLLAGKDWEHEDCTKMCDQGNRTLTNLIKDNLSAKRGYVRYSSLEWLRWWRWNGMIAMECRSFGAAERSLLYALNFAITGKDATEVNFGEDQWHSLGSGMFSDSLRDKESLPKDNADFGVSQNHPDALRIEVLRTIEAYVALHLWQLGSKVRLNSLKMGSPTENEDENKERRDALVKEWKEALINEIRATEGYIEHGQRLVSFIRGKDHSSNSNTTAQANWCASRLWMHRSACATHRVQIDSLKAKEDLLQHAMGYLGDAEASLRISDPKRFRTELAFVELHRADARLREAESVPIKLINGEEITFADLCGRLEKMSINRLEWVSKGVKIRKEYLGGSKDEVQGGLDTLLKQLYPGELQTVEPLEAQKNLQGDLLQESQLKSLGLFLTNLLTDEQTKLLGQFLTGSLIDQTIRYEIPHQTMTDKQLESLAQFISKLLEEKQHASLVRLLGNLLKEKNYEWLRLFLGNLLKEEQRKSSVQFLANLRRAKSLVDDGIRFLNRAEPVLRERRRNVWWTTWFFERRLRAISLSMWASVFEEGTPIPFVGLEAAVHGTRTSADHLLENSIRMVRSDAYRLATIVNAYASCTKALQVRLMLEADSPRLPGRQISMYENLDNALKHLKNISEKRDKLAKDIEKKNKEDKRIRDYAMDHDLKDYIEEVIKRCQEISLQVKDAY